MHCCNRDYEIEYKIRLIFLRAIIMGGEGYEVKK